MDSCGRRWPLLDASLLEAAETAVARGNAPTLSAWVNDALRLKLDPDV